MAKLFGLDVTGSGARRELILLGMLALAVLGVIYMRSAARGQPSRAASQSPATPSAMGTPAHPTGTPTISRLRMDLIRKNRSGQGEETPPRRNPFVFVKPKPKPEELAAAAAPPPKPRPQAEYQGYLVAGGKRYALIKMNNDAQVVPEGSRLPSGYLLAKVDPTEIVLKDADGETYSFPLPR